MNDAEKLKRLFEVLDNLKYLMTKGDKTPALELALVEAGLLILAKPNE